MGSKNEKSARENFSILYKNIQAISTFVRTSQICLHKETLSTKEILRLVALFVAYRKLLFLEYAPNPLIFS